MPRRPPRKWMRDCVEGVEASGSAVDPGAVCGAQWHHKMTPAAKRAALRRERDNPGPKGNPVHQHCKHEARTRVVHGAPAFWCHECGAVGIFDPAKRTWSWRKHKRARAPRAAAKKTSHGRRKKR